MDKYIAWVHKIYMQAWFQLSLHFWTHKNYDNQLAVRMYVKSTENNYYFFISSNNWETASHLANALDLRGIPLLVRISIDQQTN